MGACGACCRCVKWFFLILLFVLGLFAFPPTRDPLMVATWKQADNVGVFVTFSTFRTFASLGVCSPAFLTGGKNGLLQCVKDGMATDQARMFGWEPGFGVMPIIKSPLTIGPMGFGHAAYKNISYDTKMGRSATHLSGMDITTGLMSPGMDKLLVNFATGDAEWVKRRALIVDSFPALLEKPPVATDIVTPEGVSPTAFASERAIHDFVGLNIFKQLFGADVTAELAAMDEYDSLIKSAFVAGGGSAISATGGLEKLEACRQALYARVENTAPAQNMMTAAQKLGYDGKTRMLDFLWILMFAGYGGAGDLTIATFNTVRTNPEKFVNLYRKDPDAFVLEAARLHPSVAGQNPSILPRGLTIKDVDGTPRTFPPGSPAGMLSSGANQDPTLYPDPQEFKPERANLDRILTWNAELRDIRKCSNTAGFPTCKEAPRPCPGTWLAIRVAKAAVAFFMDGVEKSLGKSSEL